MSHRPSPPSAEVLDDVLVAYERLPSKESDEARELRRRFLERLDPDVDDERRSRYGRFLATEIQPGDLDVIQFDDPAQAVRVLEILHRFPHDDEDQAARVRAHGEHLLRSALLRFERRDDLEGMFDLLRVAPPALTRDPELVRLRNRARLYEERRVRRRRRWLYVYLAVQALLVTVVFPLLFINAENGRLQAEIEQAVDVDVEPSTARQDLSFRDGLYWSIITAASIGYGDITPRTAAGRGIAATLGTMGVVTIGVMAGLVLAWISPRRLD